MSSTYRCGGCNATWSAEGEPTGCPKCGGRFVEPVGRPGSPINDPYFPPGASISEGKPVSSTSFSVLYWLGWVGFIAGFLVLIAAIASMENKNPGQPPTASEPLMAVAMLLLFASGLCLTVAQIISFVKIYRGWKAIQPLRQLDRDEAEMATPGKAVGFLFIPLFNIYWMFVAFHGLAVRANKYMTRSGIQARRMSEGLALTYCIMVLCTAIPFVGLLLLPVIAVIYYLFILDIDRMRGAVRASGGGDFKPAFGDGYEAV